MISEKKMLELRVYEQTLWLKTPHVTRLTKEKYFRKRQSQNLSLWQANFKGRETENIEYKATFFVSSFEYRTFHFDIVEFSSHSYLSFLGDNLIFSGRLYHRVKTF